DFGGRARAACATGLGERVDTLRAVVLDAAVAAVRHAGVHHIDDLALHLGSGPLAEVQRADFVDGGAQPVHLDHAGVVTVLRGLSVLAPAGRLCVAVNLHPVGPAIEKVIGALAVAGDLVEVVVAGEVVVQPRHALMAFHKANRDGREVGGADRAPDQAVRAAARRGVIHDRVFTAAHGGVGGGDR